MPSASPAPESLFAAWIARREAGEEADLEGLCRDHPEHERRLRELHAMWAALDAARRQHGLGGSLAERLTTQYGSQVDPKVTLEGEGDKGDFSSEVLARLAGRGPASTRYRLKGEVAHGGMGAVLRVWDEDLRRHLAMKVMLGEGLPSETGDTPAADPKLLARFLEEAQVTGQLDHPGIVPVHELGLDPEGRVYFTMKLVKGKTLEDVLDELARGEGGWTQTRVLGLLLKVCEAMAYAHAKGVIHRDLKPANVMIGRYGEVFVMDWGLARVLGREDAKDLRIRDHPAPAMSEVHSDRRERAGQTPDSPLLTMDGDVLGTPAYMPPEQAKGMVAEIGPHSDVYAIGAMLYHLLAGHMPYVPSDSRPSNYAVLRWALEGPPSPVDSEAPDSPAELTAICKKAMSRDVAQRYPDTSSLAEDLRAYLENRVVQAHCTGALAELRKWVERNRALSVSLAASLALVVAGSVTISIVLSRKNRVIDQERIAAEQESERVLGLADIKRLDDLLEEAAQLYPAHPRMITPMRDWLTRARSLSARLTAHRDHLDRVREKVEATTATEAALAEAGAALTSLTIGGEELVRMESGVTYSWLAERLASLVQRLEEFGDPDPSIGTIADVRRRLDHAVTIHARSVHNFREAWDHAIASISDRAECPWYDGLVITPQLGLVPIGPDPRSGLWEFVLLSSRAAPSLGDLGLDATELSFEYNEHGVRFVPHFDVPHSFPSRGDRDAFYSEARARGEQIELLRSDLDRRVAEIQESEVPVRAAESGELVIDERTGLVLVLVPGGTFSMGAQSTNPAAPNYDPHARPDEQPVRRVTVSPFFLSKYEMTQAQWLRLTGTNPSYYRPGGQFGRTRPTLLHPVERLSWLDAQRWLHRCGLELPTEAQWEWAARGGSTTPWSSGADAISVQTAANLADAAAQVAGPEQWMYESWDDGFTVHAPVGSFSPNDFGFHDMHGNVAEWCLDAYLAGAYGSSPPVDPAETGDDTSDRVVRGGSFNSTATSARSSYRYWGPPSSAEVNLGLRPARAIAP